METNRNRSQFRLAYHQFIEAKKGDTVLRSCAAYSKSRPEATTLCLKPISERNQEDERLLRLIRTSFDRSHGVYGAPRVFLDLREAGETCSMHRVERLTKVSTKSRELPCETISSGYVEYLLRRTFFKGNEKIGGL